LGRFNQRDGRETLSRYVDDDGNLTSEGELSYLRFRAGAKTVDDLIDSAGPDWLIEGWLATSATMVAGAPESGKSSLVASMAAAVASGEPWLGTPVSSERRGPVVVIGSDPSDISQWAKKAQALSVPADAWELIDFDRKRWEVYEELAAELESRLLVFDNITSALDGPINDADPSAILGPLKRIATAGTPVVVIAHTGKGGSKDPMGPTAYKAWRRHGIHVAGSGDRPRKLTRAGNVGIWPDVVVNGAAIGSAVEYQLAEGSTSKPNRSSSWLDQNAEIADWVVKNCQGVGVNEVGKRVAAEFGGAVSSWKTALKQDALCKVLNREGERGSTVWSLKK
jgi:hypothetical protein